MIHQRQHDYLKRRWKFVESYVLIIMSVTDLSNGDSTSLSSESEDMGEEFCMADFQNLWNKPPRDEPTEWEKVVGQHAVETMRKNLQRARTELRDSIVKEMEKQRESTKKATRTSAMNIAGGKLLELTQLVRIVSAIREKRAADKKRKDWSWFEMISLWQERTVGFEFLQWWQQIFRNKKSPPAAAHLANRELSRNLWIWSQLVEKARQLVLGPSDANVPELAKIAWAATFAPSTFTANDNLWMLAAMAEATEQHEPTEGYFASPQMLRNLFAIQKILQHINCPNLVNALCQQQNGRTLSLIIKNAMQYWDDKIKSKKGATVKQVKHCDIKDKQKCTVDWASATDKDVSLTRI